MLRLDMDHVHTGATQGVVVLSWFVIFKVLGKTWGAHHVSSPRGWVADLAAAVLYVVD